MSKSVRAQRSGAYLQETVISIFVAGTMELSGSKSPIVAMAEAIFYLFSLNQLFSVPEVRTFITVQTFLWLCVCVPSNRECESAASGSSSCCCRWSASGQEAYLRMRLSFTARESERERAKLTEPDALASLRLCPLNSVARWRQTSTNLSAVFGLDKESGMESDLCQKKNPKGSLCKERPFGEHYKIVLYLYTHRSL